MFTSFSSSSWNVGNCNILLPCVLWYREFNNLSKLQKLSTDHCLSNIYVVSFCITLLGVLLVFISNNFQYWIYFSSVDLAAFTYIDTIFYVLLFALQGNALQREATINQNMLSIKRTFFRYMSHEIRTPMNTVMMGLQFLEEDMMKQADSTVRLQTLADIKESCDIAIKTLNDMLIYDKIETCGLVLEKGTIDIIDLVETSTRPFQLQASKSNITLRINNLVGESEVDGPLLVSADASKMAQVIRNITSNALKFTPGGGSILITLNVLHQPQQQQQQGSLPSPSFLPFSNTSTTLPSSGGTAVGGALTATVTPKVVQRYIKIEITDTGHGISEENQSKLFHGIIQFSPGKLQNGGGSGLGLYISKGIIDSHGGSLSVYSNGEGFGSTFTVLLPLLNTFPTSSTALLTCPPQPTTAGAQTTTSPPVTALTLLSTSNDTKHGIHSSLAYLEQTTQKFPLLSTIRRHTISMVLPDKPILGGAENTSSENAKSLRIHSDEKFPSIYLKSDELWHQLALSLPRSRGMVVTGGTKPVQNYLSYMNQSVATNANFDDVDAPRNNRWPGDCSVKPFSSGDVTENKYPFVNEVETNLQRGNSKEIHYRAFNCNNNPDEVAGGGGGGGGGNGLSSKQTLAGLSPKYKYRLLVVDDVSMNRKMMIRLLGDRCSRIWEAANGLEAVEQVQEAARAGIVFDVITMDYQMPIMDGPTATLKIRELGYQGIILGLTGNVLPSDMNVFLLHGVNRVLVKPLDIKVFDLTVQELFASASRRSSSASIGNFLSTKRTNRKTTNREELHLDN